MIGERLRMLLRRLGSLFRRGSLDADLDEEIRAHIEMATEAYLRQGMAPEEAARAARRDFGGVDQVKERHREGRGIRWMDDLRQELRIGVRSLVRRPGFAAVTVSTLSLGIGATVAVFAVVDGVLLKPLPFDEPDELIAVSHQLPGLGLDEVSMDRALYFTYRDESRALDEIGVWNVEQVAITGLDEPEQVSAANVTAGLFPLLGVRPVVGRVFTEEEDSPAGPGTALLGYAYWQRAFAGDANAVGRTLRVDGLERVILGVMPREFTLPDGGREAEIYLPFRWDPAEAAMGSFGAGQAIARMTRPVSLETARADLERMIPMATERFPGRTSLEMLREAGFGPDLRPLREEFVGDVDNVLWVLFGAVAIILLVASANVANLALARSERRRRETAVRKALGASDARISRHFLGESLALGLAGGLVGLGMAALGVRLLVAMGPEGLPRLSEIGIDVRVIAFALGISIVSGLCFGLLPAAGARALDLVGSLREGGRGGTADRTRHRTRNTLVVAQVALALVLLAGSGLMVRSFQALRAVDPGFADSSSVLTFRVAIPESEVSEMDEVVLTFEDISNRLAEIPGVASVGASSSIAMDGLDIDNAIQIEDEPPGPGRLSPVVRHKWVTGGYNATIGNRLLAGRAITWADIHEGEPVVVVTESFAEDHWGAPSAALGERVARGDRPDLIWHEIVGVAGDIRDDGLDQPAPAVVFWPVTTSASPSVGGGGEPFQRTMAFAVGAGTADASSLLSRIRTVVWEVNPTLPLANVRTLAQVADRSMARTSFTLVMLAIAGAVALALGVVGVYGVTSYVVSRRTREIGVRMAVGADRGAVRRMVLGQGALLAVYGIGIGLVAAFGLTRLLSSLLYGVRPSDPATFAAATALLASVALGAAYVPARRASGTDPIRALKEE